MQVVDRSRKANRQTQEKRQIQWMTEQLIERHTAWVLELKDNAVRIPS